MIIGASTGGTRVLPLMLSRIPVLPASVVVVQHMPAFINASFVGTLQRHSAMRVKLAETGDRLQPGVVYVAPSDTHCYLGRNQQLTLMDGPKVNFVRPAVDVTMQSVTAPCEGQTWSRSC